MNKSHYSTIWAVTGLAGLYYALNAWIVTQGGSEIFAAKLVLGGRAPAALLAFPICSVLLFVASLAGIAYAKSDEGGLWPRRIPILGFKTLNTDRSKAAKFYQAAALVAVSLLPAAAIIHFGDILLAAHVVVGGQEVSAWDFGATTTANDPARICSELAQGQCVDGATFFPGWQAFAYLIMAVVVAAALLAHWGAVFAPRLMPKWLMGPA